MESAKILDHLTQDKRDAIARVLDEEVTKSGKIRGLYAAGIEVKDIAHILDVKYNFAYNVVAQLIKDGIVPKQPEKPITAEEQKLQALPEPKPIVIPGDTDDRIINLWINGKESEEISQELQIDFDYVIKIVRAMKNKLAQLARALTNNNDNSISL
jgi:hypothetical protein